MRAKILGLLAVGLLAGPIAAKATSISWALENVTLNDGAALTGTFTTDAGTSQVLTFDFALSGGPFSGNVWSNSLPGSYTFAFSPSDFVGVGNAAGNVDYISFAAPLVPTQFSDPVDLIRFFGNGFSYFSYQYFAGAAVQVPEPATLSLLGLGLAGLGFIRRRKKS
jgi:hypothetical protein